MTEVVAALDCGSNSTRVLIANASTTLHREMRITRLSQGVDAAGQLAPEALARSYHALEDYAALMGEYGVSRGLLVATSAVRDASNGRAFLEEAARITGVECRILNGQEEATYSYAGATAGLAQGPSPLILDIGGGSSELAVRDGDALLSYSMQLGCVRVSERTLGRDASTPETLAATFAMIDAQLDAALAAVPRLGDVAAGARLVGLAGTVATLAQLDQGLAVYDRDKLHHHEMTLASVREWRLRLCAMAPAERLALPGMAAGREDVIHAGLCILERVMERLGLTTLTSSESDILDGIVGALVATSAP